MIVVLDTGPLGLLANPKPRPAVIDCRRWADDLLAAGHRVVIPEIADYEVRRELVRANLVRSLRSLHQLHHRFEYLPLTTAMMREAAMFWAIVRNAGLPTAGPAELDGDVILAAQAASLADPQVVVATANLGHLGRFVAADLWTNIRP